MKKYIFTLIKGIFAGICIGVGGWLFITSKNSGASQVLSAFMFSIGLILICNFKFFLYTGKICYLGNEIKNKNGLNYSLQLLIGLVGNYIGAVLVGFVISKTLHVPDFVYSMVTTTLAYDCWQLLILGAFCGMLIYFAVEAFAKVENIFGKYVILMMCVAGFIVCGFEHCIADMFYFAVAGNFSVDSIIAVLLIIVGNSLGGLLVPLVRMVIYE